MRKYYILMGDIIRSRSFDASRLREDFLALVSNCNQEQKGQILSPFTVTLGDEFQGVAKSLPGLLESIFHLEETCLRKGFVFKTRYVGLQGIIETPINQLKAHGMMGPGLTRAREILTDKYRGKPRFTFHLDDLRFAKRLNALFVAIDGITNRWTLKDGNLIMDMLKNKSNKEIGQKYKKTRAQIWKRRKNLLIEEYRSLKEVTLDMAQ